MKAAYESCDVLRVFLLLVCTSWSYYCSHEVHFGIEKLVKAISCVYVPSVLAVFIAALQYLQSGLQAVHATLAHMQHCWMCNELSI